MSMTFNILSFVLVFSLSLSDDDKVGTLDAILGTAYCRTQMYLSKQMAQLRPEITMPMFSGESFLNISNLMHLLHNYKGMSSERNLINLFEETYHQTNFFREFIDYR